MDLLDRLGEAHGEIEEDVPFICGSGGTGEVSNVPCGGEGPVEDNEEGEEETTEGIEPPELRVKSNCLVLAYSVGGLISTESVGQYEQVRRLAGPSSKSSTVFKLYKILYSP